MVARTQAMTLRHTNVMTRRCIPQFQRSLHGNGHVHAVKESGVDELSRQVSPSVAASRRLGISAAQCRGARGLLNLGRKQLAELSGVSPATVHSIENGGCHLRLSALARVRSALEELGVVFIKPADGGEGVWLRGPKITAAVDEEFISRLMTAPGKQDQPSTDEGLRTTSPPSGQTLSRALRPDELHRHSGHRKRYKVRLDRSQAIAPSTVAPARSDGSPASQR